MKRLKLVLAVLGASALLAVTASPASAFNPAYNMRTQTIARLPATNAMTCITRHIELAAGTYTWKLSGLETGPSYRYNLVLDKGFYQWTDCLQYSSPGDYWQGSVLDPDAAGKPNATLGNWDYSQGGSYYWGSMLS